MKTIQLIKPAVAVTALVSVIGLAYAQTGTGTPSQPGSPTPPAANTNTAPMNNAATPNTNRPATPANERAVSPGDPAQTSGSSSTTGNERVARADRG